MTVGIGYLKFARRPAAAPAGAPEPVGGEVAERLAALERKLDALGRALRE